MWYPQFVPNVAASGGNTVHPIRDFLARVTRVQNVISTLSSQPVHAAWLERFKRILKPDGLLVATTRPRPRVY
jgi:hypothetical protein